LKGNTICDYVVTAICVAFVTGKIVDNTNADVAVDEYHRYEVR